MAVLLLNSLTPISDLKAVLLSFQNQEMVFESWNQLGRMTKQH